MKRDFANIPGIRWVEKSRFTFNDGFVKGHRSYIGPAHLRFNGDLPNEVETMFELCLGSHRDGTVPVLTRDPRNTDKQGCVTARDTPGASWP